MRVLDLFSGLRGWSDPWKERGHEVFTVDNDPRFEPSLVADIITLEAADLPWRPDVILASPPCEAFSIMTIGRNWNHDRTPKTEKAEFSVQLVRKTLTLVAETRPVYWVMENPRAMLRKLITGPLNGGPPERVTVTYCQYGEPFRKPTDLWGGFPPSWSPRPMCLNGAPCHVRAPRGSRTGIQGPRAKFRGGLIEDMIGYSSRSPERRELSALRAKIPEQLAREVCLAAEEGFRGRVVA